MNDQSLSKNELELQKLDLEVQVLRAKVAVEEERAKLDVSLLRSTFRRTLIIAVLSASVPMTIAVIGWTIQSIQARRAASLTEQYRREERYNKMIENLGNPSPSLRLAAASGLSEYARPSGRLGERETSAEVINALTNRLGIEEDAGVQLQILITIGSVGKTALPYIANANRSAAAVFVQHSGNLAGLLSIKRTPTNFEGFDEIRKIQLDDLPAEVEPISLDLELVARRAQVEKKEESSDSKDSSLASLGMHLDVLYMLPRFNAAFGSHVKRANSVKPDQIDAGISTAQADFRRSARFLLATNMAMEQVLRASSGNLRGENLDGIVIIWGNFRKLDLKGVSFRDAYLRGDMAEADLSFCDFSGSGLHNLYVARAKFRGATLTEAKVPVELEWAKEAKDLPDLTGANWWEAYYIFGEDGKWERPNYLEKFLPEAVQKEERRKLLAEWTSQN